MVPANSVELKQLVVAFGYHVDRRDYGKAIALFSADCEVRRPGAHFKGHAGLREMLNARPTDVQTLHIFTNLLFDATSPSSPVCDYCFVLFAGKGSEDGHPFAAAPPAMCGRITDRFVKTQDGWRICNRDTSILFAQS